MNKNDAAFERAGQLTNDPVRLSELVIEGLAEDVAQHHTRGCPFINAAAEYPEPTSGVRIAVARHREWFRGQLEELLEAREVEAAPNAARELVLLRDAAMVGGYLDGWDVVRPGFIAAARRAARLD